MGGLTLCTAHPLKPAGLAPRAKKPPKGGLTKLQNVKPLTWHTPSPSSDSDNNSGFCESIIPPPKSPFTLPFSAKVWQHQNVQFFLKLLNNEAPKNPHLFSLNNLHAQKTVNTQ